MSTTSAATTATTIEPGAVIRRPAGVLDAHTVCAFRSLLADVDGSVIVDLRDVTFIDSACLGVLVSLIRRLSRTGATVTLRSPRRPIARVLHVVGLDRFVE
jgi:anti-anti-sigma factor